MQPALDRAEGHVELPGDLDERLAVDVEGEQGLAVEVLQPRDRLPEPLGTLAADQLGERIVALLARPFEDDGLDARRRQPPRGAVDRHPHRDLAEPAGEPLGLAELVDPPEDVEEDLLRHLDRLARVAEPSQADRVHRALELLDQDAEGLAVAGLRPADQDRHVRPVRRLALTLNSTVPQCHQHGYRPPILWGSFARRSGDPKGRDPLAPTGPRRLTVRGSGAGAFDGRTPSSYPGLRLRDGRSRHGPGPDDSRCRSPGAAIDGDGWGAVLWPDDSKAIRSDQGSSARDRPPTQFNGPETTGK